MFNTKLVRTVAALVVGLVLMGGVFWGAAQENGYPDIQQLNDAAAAFVNYFKIGNRPPVITVAEIEQRISHLPDFGEKTTDIMKKAAPIETVSKLLSLKNSKGNKLFTTKQVILLLALYNLKP
ncbi:MAG: hypothetical protein NZ610_05745 [Candidatus Bipolaricaulota bacterium]|nr:hypothetical protein [Candidatus Bipolaricaulota bacterium]MCS7274884.1 hypothetical protein [Candidatus Bipolaricaulota bacterium]MDW8111163.1 hypothetical protein [Candidatus Bipolaricaulota bacterium]